MRDVLKSIYPWVVFAGSVLIVAVLYWAQVFLVPVALAVLLSFVLTPVVTPLQRWFRRVPAVLMVTTAVFILLALAGWGLNRQVTSVLDELPGRGSLQPPPSSHISPPPASSRSSSCLCFSSAKICETVSSARSVTDTWR
jgi:predicted PurR-regulated permease PerM